MRHYQKNDQLILGVTDCKTMDVFILKLGIKPAMENSELLFWAGTY